MTAPAARIRRIELQRRPKLRRSRFAGRKYESGRHDAEHRTRFAVQPDIAPQNGAIASEGSLPQVVRKHSGRRRVRRIVSRSDQAAHLWLHAEQWQQSTGHGGGLSAHRVAFTRQVYAEVDPSFDSIP